MKRLLVLLTCCGALLAGAPGAALASPPAIREADDTVAAQRLQAAMAAIGQANGILASVFDPRMAQPMEIGAMAAMIDAKTPRISAGLAELDALDASLVALETLGDRARMSEQVADSFVKHARDQVAATKGALNGMLELGEAAATGDIAAVNAVLTRMQLVSAISLEATAMASRGRVALFPPGQSQGNQGRAFAALLEGVSMILRYRAGERAAEDAAVILLAKAAEVKSETTEGRLALTEELRNGASDPRDSAIMASVAPLQRETFDLVEAAGAILTEAADDIRRGRNTSSRIAEFNALQVKLQDIVSRQTALFAQSR